MKNKLENLLGFNDFVSSWTPKQHSKTKRTDTGVDILKEGLDLEEKNTNEIEELINDADEGQIDYVVDFLRDVLLELEQQGLIDADYTDNLDDKHDGDWVSWILEVCELEQLPEDTLTELTNVLTNDEEFGDFGDDDDVECPDCDGTGEDTDGSPCERCDGEGRVTRPNDIPPDDFREDDDEQLYHGLEN